MAKNKACARNDVRPIAAVVAEVTQCSERRLPHSSPIIAVCGDLFALEQLVQHSQQMRQVSEHLTHLTRALHALAEIGQTEHGSELDVKPWMLNHQLNARN